MSDWEKVQDKNSGEFYFWNKTTNETTWDDPTKKKPDKKQVKIKAEAKTEVEEPQDWESVKSKDGRSYFWNRKTNKTQWDMPQVLKDGKPGGVASTSASAENDKKDKKKREKEEEAKAKAKAKEEANKAKEQAKEAKAKAKKEEEARVKAEKEAKKTLRSGSLPTVQEKPGELDSENDADNWEFVEDQTGNTAGYYWNYMTDKTSWDPPAGWEEAQKKKKKDGARGGESKAALAMKAKEEEYAKFMKEEETARKAKEATERKEQLARLEEEKRRREEKEKEEKRKDEERRAGIMEQLRREEEEEEAAAQRAELEAAQKAKECEEEKTAMDASSEWSLTSTDKKKKKKKKGSGGSSGVFPSPSLKDFDVAVGGKGRTGKLTTGKLTTGQRTFEKIRNYTQRTKQTEGSSEAAPSDDLCLATMGWPHELDSNGVCMACGQRPAEAKQYQQQSQQQQSQQQKQYQPLFPSIVSPSSATDLESRNANHLFAPIPGEAPQFGTSQQQKSQFKKMNTSYSNLHAQYRASAPTDNPPQLVQQLLNKSSSDGKLNPYMHSKHSGFPGAYSDLPVAHSTLDSFSNHLKAVSSAPPKRQQRSTVTDRTPEPEGKLETLHALQETRLENKALKKKNAELEGLLMRHEREHQSRAKVVVERMRKELELFKKEAEMREQLLVSHIGDIGLKLQMAVNPKVMDGANARLEVEMKGLDKEIEEIADEMEVAKAMHKLLRIPGKKKGPGKFDTTLYRNDKPVMKPVPKEASRAERALKQKQAQSKKQAPKMNVKKDEKKKAKPPPPSSQFAPPLPPYPPIPSTEDFLSELALAQAPNPMSPSTVQQREMMTYPTTQSPLHEISAFVERQESYRPSAGPSAHSLYQ